MFGIRFVLWFSHGPLVNPWWRRKAPKKGNKSVFLLLQKDKKLLFSIFIPIYSISGCSNRNRAYCGANEIIIQDLAKKHGKIQLQNFLVLYLILRGIWKCPFQWIFSNVGTFFQMTAYFCSFMAAVDNMDIYVTIRLFRLNHGCQCLFTIFLLNHQDRSFWGSLTIVCDYFQRCDVCDISLKSILNIMDSFVQGFAEKQLKEKMG